MSKGTAKKIFHLIIITYYLSIYSLRILKIFILIYLNVWCIFIITEPPNPPTDLIITDIDKHAVTLTWEPPEYDGGSPVTGYVVERLDPSTGIWRYALNCPRPACTVNCLDEHQEHRFRVMAENMFAVSEPSKASMAATTKEPIPTINYEDFCKQQFMKLRS